MDDELVLELLFEFHELVLKLFARLLVECMPFLRDRRSCLLMREALFAVIGDALVVEDLIGGCVLPSRPLLEDPTAEMHRHALN